jgi:hypothetical protein
MADYLSFAINGVLDYTASEITRRDGPQSGKPSLATFCRAPYHWVLGFSN